MTLADLALTCEALANDMLGELPDDPETLHQLWADALRARGAMSDVVRHLESALGEAMGAKQAIVGGVTLERHKSTREKWDHDYVLSRVLSASRDERQRDFDTGVIEPAEEALLRVLRAVASISRYRIGELKKRGIDIDAAREVEYGRWTVKRA